MPDLQEAIAKALRSVFMIDDIVDDECIDEQVEAVLGVLRADDDTRYVAVSRVRRDDLTWIANAKDQTMSDTYAGTPYATVRDFYCDDKPGWVRVPPSEYAYSKLGARWYVRCMIGCVLGRIGAEHQVEEHDDGTITVSPSLVMHQGWHGWIRRGVFEVIEYGHRP